jgi:hypothetical protein
MANSIKISKTVFNKDQFKKVVDTNFKSFAQPIAVDEDLTVEQFFAEYENLFYEIPSTGDSQSHQYLVEKSSEVVDFEKDTEDIQPLLDEITQLRQQILDYQQQIIELSTPTIG